MKNESLLCFWATRFTAVAALQAQQSVFIDLLRHRLIRKLKFVEQKRCGTCPYLKQGKEFTFSATNETFRIKHSMNCTSTNLIYVITCAGCGHNYIGETGDVLRNRVTVHKQQIRDPHTRMLGVSKHIDECAAGLTPQFTIFPFYKILSILTYFRDRDFIEITKPKRTTETR